MTYLQFLLLFLLPPLLWLWRPRGRWRSQPRALLTALLLPVIALLYTTPWDNYLVATGVWTYGADRVLGTIGWVPIEEYLFFILQPLLVLGWLLHVQLPGAPVARRPLPVVAGWLVIAFMAGLLLALERTRYLALILVWAAPVLAVQWWFTGDVVHQRFRRYLAALVPPTLYLWSADWLAIRLGIWHITERYTIGAHVFGLPIEEMTFFLVTNLLSIHGALLLLEPERLR